VVIGTPVGTVAPPPVVEEKRAEPPWELADEEDVRGFSFSAEAGKTYTFQTILGTLEDSTLTIYDSDGQVVYDNDDVSEDDLSSMIEWTAETRRTYFIVVGGFGGGSFELSAFEGKGANRKELKLAELAVADGRLMFASDTSNDNEEADNGDDSLLSDNYDELDFSDQWDWGFDI